MTILPTDIYQIRLILTYISPIPASFRHHRSIRFSQHERYLLEEQLRPRRRWSPRYRKGCRSRLHQLKLWRGRVHCGRERRRQEQHQRVGRRGSARPRCSRQEQEHYCHCSLRRSHGYRALDRRELTC